MWPNLIRGYSTDHFPSEDGGDGNEEGREPDEFDEELILANYKNLFWTRLIRIEGYEPGHNRKFKMGPDIVEECSVVL